MSSCEFHGPVIEKAACFFRNAFCAVEESTAALIRPSLFHLSMSGAFLMNVLFATPMSVETRLPALFVPKM